MRLRISSDVLFFQPRAQTSRSTRSKGNERHTTLNHNIYNKITFGDLGERVRLRYTYKTVLIIYSASGLGYDRLRLEALSMSALEQRTRRSVGKKKKA